MDLIVPYAVVYIFSPDREGWEKSGIEGTLFVVRTRNRQQAQEREGFAVVVLNRRGLENFVLELKTSEEVELTEEYVIVRDNGEGYEDGEPKIYGLWIFEEEGGSTKGMRRMCGEVIVERAKRVEQRNEGLRKDGSADVEQPLQEEQNDGPDLMALLNGGGKQKGTTAPTTHQGMDEGQVNLLDLFKNAEDAR